MKTKLITIIMFAMATVCVKAQTNENIFSAVLGKSKLFLLSEGQRNGSTEILIDATPELIKKYAPDNSFPMAANVFLWQINGKNILFDTGYGRNLFDNLQSIQLKPENIDVIFITHAHGDHIGGLLRDEKAAFPNAAIYMSKMEYNYWTNDSIMNQMPEKIRGGFLLTKKVVEAYKNRLHLFEPNALNPPYTKTVYPGIKAIAAYGHTPGHTVFLLESGKDKFLIWGDLAHAMAIQMPHPEIAVSYDVNSQDAIQARKVILQYVSENHIPIAGMHIAYPGMGAIKKSESGYLFVPEK
jgi:glyoxylase-like metal-dependent hydrolase (beta-lactamase superfamily II)